MSENPGYPPSYPDPAPYGTPASRPMGVGDALSWAWGRVVANPLVLLVGFGLWEVLGGWHAVVRATQDDEPGVVFLGTTLIQSVAMLLGAVATANAALVTASGRRATWRDFITFPNLGAGILAQLLAGVLTVLGFMLLVVPGIILLYLWYFTVYVTVDQGADAVEGMRRSWRLLADNTGTLVPFALAGVGLGILGAITVVGWVLTGPLTILMTAYAYIRVQGYDVAR